MKFVPSSQGLIAKPTLMGFYRTGISDSGSLRVWLESRRLGTLGFNPGQSLSVDTQHDRVIISPSSIPTSNTVSSKRASNSLRPVIDIASDRKLEPLNGHDEYKMLASDGSITIAPSVRSFLIKTAKEKKESFNVVELFAGGGTLSQAIGNNSAYNVVAACEMETDYADVYAAGHPDTLLIQSDLRRVHPTEFPDMDVLVAGIPCTSHSTMGRAKNGLKGTPELGETGDLFIPVVALVANKMPRACLFENVPSFGNSLAGQVLKSHLEKIGYHTDSIVLSPHSQWGEPSNRERWCMVATLEPGFKIQEPGRAFEGTIGRFLDPKDPVQDKADAERIARTILGLEKHNARHAAMGHGFSMSLITYEDTSIPTIARSYHKINTGPFVVTDFGPRLLRQGEIERIQGARAHTEHYATAVEVLGQGVQTRVFSGILTQLKDFLTQTHPEQRDPRDTVRAEERKPGQMNFVLE